MKLSIGTLKLKQAVCTLQLLVFCIHFTFKIVSKIFYNYIGFCILQSKKVDI